MRPCNGWEWSVPQGGPEYKGSRPYEGGCGACPKPRLLGRSLCFLSTCRPPGRGRGDVMGLRPLRSPLPTPRSTPLGFPGGHCSHGSVGFWEEPTRTTPARKGRYEGMTFGPRPARRWAVLSRADSGDELRANGALGGGSRKHRQGSGTGRRLFGGRYVWPGGAVRVTRRWTGIGRSKGNEGRSRVARSSTPAPYSARRMARSSRRYFPRNSKLDTRSRSPKPRESQGTSATAGSASSRSASEQGDSAKREKPCEQATEGGRRP